MAISVERRKEIMAAIGYEYSEEGIKKLQSDYMARKSDVDGKWGPNTENCALTVYYVKKHTKNFKPKEFMCECGGRYCCGYPDYMKPEELVHIQTIRDHYGRPITITSGLRCKGWNKHLNGSVENSGHLKGFALDFYQRGVTDTVDNRKKSIEYMESLPNHKFSYGKAMKGSDGVYRRADYMGNAMHTETKAGSISTQPVAQKVEAAPAKASKLTVDGVAGVATIKAAQRKFGTVVDGYITGQNKNLKRYYPGVIAVRCGSGGSSLVVAIQKWVGVAADGVWGKATSKGLQKKLKALGYYYGEIDGIAGEGTIKAWQHYLNGDEAKKPYEGQVIDVSEFQDSINWEKVKATGIVGAIIRCGYRGCEKGTLNEDAHFMEHIKGAHAAGLKIGVYMFTEGINASEGKEEAAYALNLIKKAGVPLSYPIAVDTEPAYYKKNGKRYAGRANGLSQSKRTEVIKAFCEEIIRQGYKPMIYASLSWLNNKLNISKLPYDVWVAQYNSTCDYKGSHILWQYTSTGTVDGIKGDVDMNRCYIK